MENTQEKLIKIVSEILNIEINKINPADTFIEDLGSDSLDVVEIVMKIEDEFDITIPDAEAEKLTTVQKAIDYVEAHI